MKLTVTLRKITITVLMVIGLIARAENSSAQVLPCVDSAFVGGVVGGITLVGPVCGCDGIQYNSWLDALDSLVTHFTYDSCGVTPLCHADFTYEIDSSGQFLFIDSSSASGNQTYLWEFGDTLTSTLSSPSHTYYYPGLYIVALTITDTSSSSTTCRLIKVNSGLCTSCFYVYLFGAPANCSNNGTITANIFGGISPYSFLWSNGDTTQTITGLSGGNYFVTVTDNYGLITDGFYDLNSTCNNVLEGTIFNDINNNCIFDGGETTIQTAYVIASNGSQNFYGNVDANGNYSIDIPAAGTYTIIAYSWSYGYGGCGNLIACNGNTVIFPSVGDTLSGNNFGSSSSTQHDLGIFATWTGANPGFQMYFDLYPYDLSNPSFVGLVTTVFHYDANLVYDSSNNAQVAHNSVTHTLTHVGAGAASWYFGAPPIICYFHVPDTLSPNYVVESDFYIDPVNNDCDTSNNHLHTSSIVTGSYDPNEKTVTPSGNITSSDSVLTYTIHFQNTGTDSTHFVIVKDTLSQYLNPATVVNLASSAPYSDFNISGTGILTWIFNPLFLPDSASNEAASKGFVMFKVKVKPNLAGGTEINNKASIYFDYNDPVVTNTASNTFITGIKEINESGAVTVYPNPTSDAITVNCDKIINTISITDILGREIFKRQINQKSVICNMQSLSQGIYFLKVTDANGIAQVKKIVKE